MLLAIDIGNTNTSLGVFDGERLATHWRLTTERSRTGDEWGVLTRNLFAPGRGSHPHFHDQARYITVIKGTWWVSLGSEADVYNPDKMTPVKQGSFIFEPAFGHHYDMAKDEEVIVQIMGPGPVKTTQLENNGATSGDRSGGAGRGGRN